MCHVPCAKCQVPSAILYSTQKTMKLIATPAIFFLANALFCINSSAQTTPQSAASYPSKPIRMVVPFTPGGSTDILARAIGLELTKAWGQPVVIDNVPDAPVVLGQVKNGQLRAIAVSRPTRLNNEGAVSTPSTPEVFGELIVKEIARWKPVMTSGRVKAD